MTLREFLTPPPTLFRSDPQSVEAVTGWFIATVGFWCWFAQWFNLFLPNVEIIQGWEWVVAVVFTPYGVMHTMRAHRRNTKRRAAQAFIASGLFVGLAVVVWYHSSWRQDAVPVLMLGSVVQGWCYLRLRLVIQ